MSDITIKADYDQLIKKQLRDKDGNTSDVATTYHFVFGRGKSIAGGFYISVNTPLPDRIILEVPKL